MKLLFVIFVGYGMVMPPFPPPPYMEAPAYVLPHSHIQPVDYRRLLHPQVHTPSVPYQNPNQTRRIRLPHTVPIRETVNSAVQTEPTQRGGGSYSDGSPPIRSDSGHGTTSNSPASSSSGSRKQGSAEVENYTLPSSNVKELQVNMTCTNGTVKHSFNIQHPTGAKTVQTCIRATVQTQKCHKDSAGQMNVPPYRNGDRNMWSVSSPDSMVPVCSSSQQEDEVVRERHISIPDILSWGGDMQQATILKMADKVPPQTDHQLPSYETEVEKEKSVYHSQTEPKNGPVVAHSADAENIGSFKDSETIFKILKLPFALHDLHSESRRDNEPVGLIGSVSNPCKVPEDEQENDKKTNPHEDTTEIIPYQMSLNSSQMKRKMNDSVWSVESLAPFIPTKELLHKGMFEPDIIIEMMEEAENGGLSTHDDKLIVKSRKGRRQSRRFSSCDSVPMSDSWLIFSTPAERLNPSCKPEMESESDASDMMGPKQCQSMAPLEEDPLVSPTHLQSEIILSTPTEKKNRSSEPEANQSPNQESLIGNEQQGVSPCPHEEEETLLNSVAGGEISSTGQLTLQNGEGKEDEDGTCQLRNEQLCVLMADQRTTDVCQSKGHLVDCGVQCTVLQELGYSFEDLNSRTGPSRRRPFNCSGDLFLISTILIMCCAICLLRQ